MSDEILSKEDKELYYRLEHPFHVRIIEFEDNLICKDSMGKDSDSLSCNNKSCRLYCDTMKYSPSRFLEAYEKGKEVIRIDCPLSFREKGSKGSKPRLGYGRIL